MEKMRDENHEMVYEKKNKIADVIIRFDFFIFFFAPKLEIDVEFDRKIVSTVK